MHYHVNVASDTRVLPQRSPSPPRHGQHGHTSHGKCEQTLAIDPQNISKWFPLDMDGHEPAEATRMQSLGVLPPQMSFFPFFPLEKGAAEHSNGDSALRRQRSAAMIGTPRESRATPT